MRQKYALWAGLLVFMVFLSACSSPEKPIETQEMDELRKEVVDDIDMPDPDNPDGDITEISCTSEFECPNDYSCYVELPLGPTAGVQGSPSNPGKCYSDQMIGQIYAPGTSGETSE